MIPGKNASDNIHWLISFTKTKWRKILSLTMQCNKKWLIINHEYKNRKRNCNTMHSYTHKEQCSHLNVNIIKNNCSTWHGQQVLPKKYFRQRKFTVQQKHTILTQISPEPKTKNTTPSTKKGTSNHHNTRTKKIHFTTRTHSTGTSNSPSQ